MPSRERWAEGPCGWGADDELLLLLWIRYCSPSILKACCAGADDRTHRLTQADDDADFHILLVRYWTPASAAAGANALLRPTARIIGGRSSLVLGTSTNSGMISMTLWILRRLYVPS